MKDRLEQIFTRQLEYYNSLKDVYVSNGFSFHPYPLNLQDRFDQEGLRLLAWRLTEELIEAVNTRNNLLEELADGLHFLIEISLASGVSRAELFTGVEYTTLDLVGDQDLLEILFKEKSGFAIYHTIPLRIYRTIDILGQTMHHLRQRPWRGEDRLSSRKDFVAGLSLVFRSFINTVSYQFSTQNLYEAYFAKSRINDQRQGHYTV